MNSENERTWTTGCPEASLKINGGSHQYFPQSNLNRDPDTFWHSISGGGGGVVLTFKKEVAFKEVRIGARKETADWNHEFRAQIYFFDICLKLLPFWNPDPGYLIPRKTPDPGDRKPGFWAFCENPRDKNAAIKANPESRS